MRRLYCEVNISETTLHIVHLDRNYECFLRPLHYMAREKGVDNDVGRVFFLVLQMLRIVVCVRVFLEPSFHFLLYR